MGALFYYNTVCRPFNVTTSFATANFPLLLLLHFQNSQRMRFLHTSDWHLGRLLYNQQRYAEFSAFLDWMLQTIVDQQIELLIIAGDVFDTSTPSNRALTLYYDFLYRVSLTSCRNVVIVGGNHDSPSVLNAPAAVLRALHVHVVGEISGDVADELITLRDEQGSPQAIVCAVPFLRDRDVRSVVSGDGVDTRQEQLTNGIVEHYRQVAEKAEELRHRQMAEKADELRRRLMAEKAEALPHRIVAENPEKLQRIAEGGIPVIATGHLFTQSQRTEEFEGEGVRDLYVGTLAYINAGLFPATFDYIALGHIHQPQRVGGKEHIRYSGSPLAMGFREALYTKKVVVVDVSIRENEKQDTIFPQSNEPATLGDRNTENVPANKPISNLTIVELEVPVFQSLLRIDGDFAAISDQLLQLKAEGSTAWLEIELTSTELVPTLTEEIQKLLEGSAMQALKIKNRNFAAHSLQTTDEIRSLDDLTELEVFENCMADNKVPEEEREEMRESFKEILLTVSG